MNIRHCFLFFLFSSAIHAHIFMSDETLEKKSFNRAKEQFNPWYSGPLLPGTAHMMPPGNISFQNYVFVADNYARFDSQGHSKNIPNLIQFHPQINALQIGFTSWLDVSLAFQAFANWENSKESGGIGDLTFSLGFPILKETTRNPAMKIGIGELFPTGRYERFTPSKSAVQTTGQGSCLTILSYRISKMFFISSSRPINLRAAFTYTIPTTFIVHGFNSYGGGFDTHGQIRPGNQFSITAALEWLFAKNWVLLNDCAYLYNNHPRFIGNPGVSKEGSEAIIQKRSNNAFSISPALQYNPNKRLKFIGGVWLTIKGRNTYDFIQGIIGVTYTWQI